MKVCSKCDMDKEDTEFFKNKKAVDGLQNYCKPCLTTAARNSEKNNKEKVYARAEKWKKDNPEKCKANVKRWQAANQGKIKASADKRRDKVNTALKFYDECFNSGTFVTSAIKFYMEHNYGKTNIETT